MTDFKYGEITEKIIGAAFRVHKTLDCGFQEVIYQRALEIELRLMSLNYGGNSKCRFIISTSKLEQEGLIFLLKIKLVLN